MPPSQHQQPIASAVRSAKQIDTNNPPTKDQGGEEAVKRIDEKKQDQPEGSSGKGEVIELGGGAVKSQKTLGSSTGGGKGGLERIDFIDVGKSKL